MENAEKNTLRIRFLGAIGTVTGSCTLLEYTCCKDNKKRFFLVDAGSFQNESKEEHDNERKKLLKCIAKDIEIIFITHAHLDHIGILPEIIKFGFKGKICCTQATHKLMTAMLTHGESSETNSALLKKITFIDIDGRYGDKQNIGFGKTYIPITRDLRYSYLRSSHVLGSCTIYFQWTEENYPDDCQEKEKEWKFIYFSGDIGSVTETVMANIVFKRHQTPYWDKFENCIIMESTYGEKIREKDNLFQRKIEKLSEIIDETTSKNGTVIIPAFALDRAQQILIDLFYIFKNKEAKDKLPSEKTDDWKSILERMFNEKEIKNIFSSSIKTLQGKDKKQLRIKINNEIKEIKEHCKEINPHMLFKDSPDEFKNSIADIFTQNDIEKPKWHDDIRNRLNFSFDSPLIEKINEIYIDHLTDEAYDKKEDKRVMKYLSMRFLEHFNIKEKDDDILKLKSDIKELLKLCFNKNAKNPGIIVAASGMCDEGRMIPLLEKYYSDENATIILTGFQAPGTNGFFLKNLLDEKYDDIEKKAIQLKLQKTDMRLEDIKCKIKDMSNYYSGHADQEQLLDYIMPDQRNSGNITVLLNHGTNSARETLKLKIEEKNPQTKVILPEFNKWLNVSTFEYESEDIEFDTEINEFVFAKAGDIHIYYPAKYDDEKIQSIIDFINKL